MKYSFLLFIELIILTLLAYFILSFESKIDFYWNGIIFSTELRVLLFIVIFLIFLSLFMQRIYIYIKQIPKKIRSNLQTRKYKKGINAIVLSIAAMSNNDKKQLTKFSKKIDDYLEGNPISIILNAETARKDKKFIVAEELYNKMLNNPDIKIIGLRGLLELNLRRHDYHHALVYAEQIYNINYKLDWIYQTIINILTKTKNWQKLIEINNDAFNKKIITKKIKLRSNSIAQYEIALIKEQSFVHESLKLLKEANISRPNFPPFVKKYVKMLIENNQISRAKNILFNTWPYEPHLSYFEDLIKISQNQNVPLLTIVNKLISKNLSSYESILIKTKAYIYEKKWDDAKNTIKAILSNRPNKTTCELMSEIELGISGNMQKANSWISRSSLGSLEKAWVCKLTGIKQNEWTSINQSGYLDSLEWTWPKDYLDRLTGQNDYQIPEIIGPA